MIVIHFADKRQIVVLAIFSRGYFDLLLCLVVDVELLD